MIFKFGDDPGSGHIDNEETPFVKLVMGKTGCDDEKRVRGLLTWWKIKNKWKRSLSVDDAKAYRMICRKLTDNRGDI
jgi:hypothetical protein